MSEPVTVPLADLYELDETAWLEQTAKLVSQRRFKRIDVEHLSEYLSDMAIRDRREVKSRLVTLLIHLLKWEFQPKKRSNSWRGTIMEQRRELADILESGTLRHHAEAVLEKSFAAARKQAAAETGLATDKFPQELPWTLDAIVDPDADLA
jgi:hypothetical protein